MKITNWLDQVDVNCGGCCDPPSCAPDGTNPLQLAYIFRGVYLARQSQTFLLHGDLVGYENPEGPTDTKFISRNDSYAGGGSVTTTLDDMLEYYFDGVFQLPYTTTTITDNKLPKTGKKTTTYSGPKTFQQSRDDFQQIFENNKHTEIEDNQIDDEIMEASAIFGSVIRYNPNSGDHYETQFYRYKLKWKELDTEVPPDHFSYYKIEYDDVYFPSAYEGYLLEFSNWLSRKKDYENWLECDTNNPGLCGPEPPLPGDEPAQLTDPEDNIQLIGHREFEFSNTNTETDWIELPSIDTEKIPGTFYQLNMKVFCYRSSKFGIKPNFIGPQIEL